MCCLEWAGAGRLCLFTRSFEAALFWWWLAGLGLAGTYMPRLKALTDRLPVTAKSRGTAFYTATFGVGAGLYYLWVELAQPFYAWPVLFGIAGLCAAVAVVLVSLGVAGGEAAPLIHVAHDR